MDDSRKLLHCSLPRCQTANYLNRQVCSRCQTPLTKRYLWVVGTSLEPAVVNDVLAHRYLVISPKLVLDTQPGIAPYLPNQIPVWIKPYLKLSPYRLHIPKVYGIIARKNTEIWLLEYENFSSRVQAQLATGDFLPPLSEAWQGATATRQLNWLLQISQLWQPLQGQGVEETLITPGLLRVNGRIIQLQELQGNDRIVTLEELGQLWSTWIKQSQPAIQSFLQQVCHYLTAGELNRSETLVHWLEKGIAEIARSQSRSYQIATASDTGPSRSHNEDAYYQASLHSPSDQQALAIVCDGIGGHQGGEVAAKLAIDHLHQELKNNLEQSPNPLMLTETIEQAVSAVNDLICQKNDSGNRKAQQRMGTTLVMALAHHHEMYVTHVGDSRVYLITRYGCYQLTLDDDLASRQTRLGHFLYREALQQPTAGALVQALGMSGSNRLHPTTQRIFIDEDCVFLLCSDGLSDNGLVEQYWEQEILPLLEESTNLNQVAQRLIHLANTLNGHDNVTVSLVHCSVENAAEIPAMVTVPDLTALPNNPNQDKPTPLRAPISRKQQGGVGLLLFILTFMIGGMSIAYWSVPVVRHALDEFQQTVQQKLIDAY